MREKAALAQEAEVNSLVERSIGGDADSFGHLYDLYIDRIYRHLYYRVGNPDIAEDLAAQVFLNAWRAVGRYRQTGRPFIVWLLSIAHNLLVDYYRAQKDTTSVDDVIIPADDSVDPVTVAEKSFASASLRQAIRQLKHDQQVVVVMRYIDGMEYPEIAAAVSKSEGAVRVILHRALNALRGIMGNEIRELL